jgi:hypothetical protein
VKDCYFQLRRHRLARDWATILRLIDPIFSKLGRPFGQFALALSALLRRGCSVFNLFKRPFSEPHCSCGLQSRASIPHDSAGVAPEQESAP